MLFRSCSLLALLLPAASVHADAGADAGTDAGGAPTPTGLVAPGLREAVQPEYPAGETRNASVVLELTLDAGGSVSASEVVQSDGPVFDAAALELAKHLRFTPALRDGIPIAASIPFRVDFPAPAPPPSRNVPLPLPLPLPPPASSPPTPSPPPLLGDVTLEVRGTPSEHEPTRRALERDEVRTIPGTNGDVLRSIETMPGVGRPAPLDGLLIVRGAAPDDTQVFVDGTPIPFAYHFGGLNSVVPGDLLERLDFYPGNFGPEYGRAMGGIIDVGLRSPRRDRLGGVLQLDMIDGRALVEGPLSSDTRVLVAARRSWLDAWLPAVLEGADASVRAAPVYWDGQAVIEHDFSDKTRARLALFGAADSFELLLKSADASDPAVAGKLGGTVRFLRSQLRVDSQLSEHTRFSNMVSWGITNSNRTFGGDDFLFTFNEIAARSELRTRLAPALALNLGADVGYANYDVNAAFRPYNADHAAPSPAFARPSRGVDVVANVLRPALYAGLELEPLPGLKLLPSVRADYVSDTADITVDPRFATRFDLIRTPRRTTLKAGVGLYHQPPQPEQSVSPVGTPGIGSSQALHTSLGIEQELAPAFDVSLEGFYKRLSELVVAHADESRVIGARFDNSGEGRIYGAELMLRYKPPHGRFFGWLAYTLSRSERRDAARGPYYIFDWDQTHILSAVGNVVLGRGWTLGARFRYVTGTPYTPYLGGVVDLDAGSYAALSSNAPNSARLGAFHQLDLRIEKLWDFEAWQLTAYLELRNVYNRENPETVSYNYDYSRTKPVAGLPLLPVLGVRGEL